MFRPVFTRVALAFTVVVFAVVGCQQQSDSDSKASVSAKSKGVSVEITGMSCEKGCAPRARDALAALPWAKDVKVDFEKKQGTFVAETARYDEAAILKVLKDEGFDGKIVK